jgi:hypothetical protein
MAISKTHNNRKSRSPTISKTHHNHKSRSTTISKTHNNHQTSSTTLQAVLRNAAMKKVGEKSPRSGGIEPFLQLSYDEKVDWLRRLRRAEGQLRFKQIEEGNQEYDNSSGDDTGDIPTLVLSDSNSSLRTARKALEAVLLLF